ncbi:ATP-binding protein [Candidatus Amarolinea dominans]|uniref:ATP-binding protein n=1 Tax=Candidatus Amarolinea dominans TaxID=3140696 RepID=UPI001D4C01F4|nr:ATP-binding protein [Anaerolineae bacterium]
MRINPDREGDFQLLTQLCYNNAMQKLPIGIQFFDSLREGNFLYVDKTELIHRLINTGTFVFLSRPRRFGKSLLVSTLQHLFQGHRELFRGLWIEDKVDWRPRPVLVINFNDLDYHEQPLELALTNHLDRLAAEHQIQLQAEHYKEKFQELIVHLSAEQKIVLLIDEYDRAITDLLENEQKVAEHIATLKNFYSVLKTTASNHIHWTFLTGISKYGKLSLFSDLNNLLDITLDERFATLVGYTQEELERYFPDRIEALAARFEVSRPEMVEAIRFWYNGFSWDGKQTLYVPFSTLVFFELQSFENHWFATATPSFLIKLLRSNQVAAYELDEIYADNRLLDSADVNHIDAVSLLFQTGYLTIRERLPSVAGTEYRLGYPNHEVAQAFRQYLLADYLGPRVGALPSSLTGRLQKALRRDSIAEFVLILNSVFASIPHTIHLPLEAYYHSLVYLILSVLGFEVNAEEVMAHGRIDAVLELPNRIYIIEFKMTSAQVALDQIRARGYDRPYRASGKPVVLIGIAFDKEKRAIGDWKSEPVTEQSQRNQ